MKREDVKAVIPGITEEQLQKIMDLHSDDIGTHKQSIDTLKAERDAARTQLADANKKLEGYDPDWKSKAAEAEKKAGQQIAALKADYAAEHAAAGLKFSSAAARKAFLADLNAKKLLTQQENYSHYDEIKASYEEAKAIIHSWQDKDVNNHIGMDENVIYCDYELNPETTEGLSPAENDNNPTMEIYGEEDELLYANMEDEI